MSRRQPAPTSKWLIATAAVVSLVVGLIGGMPTAAFAVPPSSVTLATDKTEFAVGQTALLTATTDTAATSTYPVRIIDQTTGSTIKTCTSGTTCSISVSFLTGGAHTYVATVNGLTSNSVVVARQAWVVTLATNATAFATGQVVTLTATANQTMPVGTYMLTIYDTTTGSRKAVCTSGTTCSVSSPVNGGFFASGGPHTYVGVVSKYSSSNQGYGSLIDVQTTSNVVTLSRLAWDVGLSISPAQVQAGQQATITASLNQDLSYTSNYYAVYIYAASGGSPLKMCTTGMVCSVTTTLTNGPAASFFAVVAKRATTGTLYSSLIEIQDDSNSVQLSRQSWTTTLMLSAVEAPDLRAEVTIRATANQQLGLQDWYKGYVYDLSSGNRVFTCSANNCSQITYLMQSSPSRCYMVVIGRSTNATTSLSDVMDIQATDVLCIDGLGNVSAPPEEEVGGPNPAENDCTCDYADPINASTGEFYLPVADVGIPGAGPALEVSRTYSAARAATAGAFGYGWSAGFSSRLNVLVAGNASDPLPRLVEVRQENGSAVMFSEDENHLYTAPSRVHATLTRDAGTGQWTYTRKSKEVMVFDSAGWLLETRDLHGNTVTVGYDGSHQVTSLTASGGRTITLTWSAGRVTQVADSAGRTVSYGYTAGNLTSVTAVDGAVTGYGYDGSHRMTTLTLPGGAVTTNVYDTANRVTSQTDPIGRVTTFTYSAGSTTITAPGGSKTVETYDDGRVASITRAATTGLAATTSFTYDDANNVLSVTDPLGRVMAFTYDAAGNKLSKTDPLGRTTHWTYDTLHNPLTTTDPLGRVTTATYNSAGSLLTTTSPTGRVQQLTHNSDGTVATSVDAAGKTTTFTYDSSGRLATTTDPDGRVYTVGYTAAGYIDTVTSPDGESTATTFDAAGRVETITDPNGSVTTYAYDVRGNRTSVTDANGNVTTTTYDDADQVTSSTDAAGEVTASTYTAAGLLETITDANGNLTTYAYNALGQLTSVTDPLSRATSYAYDAAGRRLSTVLPSGATSSAAYDAAGQLVSSTDGEGEVSLFGYDLAGQLTSVTDPLGRVTTTAYTDDGERSTVTLPDTSTQAYSYTDTGLLETFTNADGKVTTYTYSDAGRLLGKVEPGGLATSMDYDDAGRTETLTLPDGSTQAFGYDDAGRLVEVHYSAVGSTDTTYVYDDGGRLTSMTDATGTTSFTYDAVGRVLSETDGDGAVVAYGYDDVGQLVSVAYPGGDEVVYGYDDAGQLVALTDWQDNTTTFGWTADGRLAEQVYPNGVRQANAYDLAGRTTAVEHSTVAAGVLAAFGYGYDAAGQLVSHTSANGGATTGFGYGYDPLDQLGSVDTTPSGGSTTSASFDATPAGQLTATAAGQTLTYNAAQQLTGLVPASGPAVSYVYDGRGSRTSSTVAAHGLDPARTTEYAYTPAGALASVATPAATVSYTVDGRGLRQSRTAGSSTEGFVWSTVGGLPLLLDDGVRRYVYGPSLAPIAQVDSSGEVEYLHGDLLGSVRAVTDGTGAVAGTADFDAFGNRVSHAGAGSAFGFTGNWTDEATGLVHLRARDYDPATGQFLTVDPAVDSTRQPYAYTGNSPLLLTDPSGLCVGIEGTAQDRPCTFDDYYWYGIPGAFAEAGMAFWAGAADGVGFNIPMLLDCTSHDKYKDNSAYWVGDVVGVLLGVATFTVGADLRIGSALASRSNASAVANDAAVVFRQDTSHIFRNATGHLAQDTAANRNLIQSAVKPQNLIGTATTREGGVLQTFARRLPDGREVWVQVLDGNTIQNGGVNLTPRH